MLPGKTKICLMALKTFNMIVPTFQIEGKHICIPRKVRHRCCSRNLNQERASSFHYFPQHNPTQLKAGFHMIADDRRRFRIANRRRSQRELFPYNRRRSQTIAEPAAAIHFGQQKCQMYTRVVLAAKSLWQTT